MRVPTSFKAIAAILTDRRGATAIEYALIASLISVAGIVGYQNLGAKVDSRYQAVDSAL